MQMIYTVTVISNDSQKILVTPPTLNNKVLPPHKEQKPVSGSTVETHSKKADAEYQKKDAQNDAMPNITPSSRRGCYGCSCQHGTGGSCHDWQLWQRCNPIPSLQKTVFIRARLHRDLDMNWVGEERVGNTVERRPVHGIIFWQWRNSWSIFKAIRQRGNNPLRDSDRAKYPDQQYVMKNTL